MKEYYYEIGNAKRPTKCQDTDCLVEIYPGDVMIARKVPVSRKPGREETYIRKFYHIPCLFNAQTRMHSHTKKVTSVEDLENYEYAGDVVKKAIPMFLEGHEPWEFEGFHPNDTDTWFLDKRYPEVYHAGHKRKSKSTPSRTSKRQRTIDLTGDANIPPMQHIEPHSTPQRRLAGYVEPHNVMPHFQEEEVEGEELSSLVPIPQSTHRIPSAFTDAQHEAIKEKFPILYDDCPLLNPVDRDQILKFILGQPHDLPDSKTLEFLMNKTGNTRIYFTLNTATKVWSKVMK